MVSAALARERGFRLLALTIDYNQRHRIEIGAATRIAAELGAERHIVLPLDLTGFGGSALTATTDVPTGGGAVGTIPVTIGRANGCTPGNNAQHVCRLLL